MFNKIKKIKEMRSQAKQVQNTLEEITAEGSGAWGKVKVKMNGNQRILNVQIDDELLQDKSKLQEGLTEAMNDAVKKTQREMAGKMKEMGGMDIFKNMGM